MAQARASELDEFSNDTMLTQHLRDGQHKIGRGGTFRQGSGETHANYFWCEQVDGLSQQYSLSLDTTHAPTQHTQAVDHGCMRVGTNQRIGIGNLSAILLFRHDNRGQVLQVDLVHNTRSRRYDAEIAESLLAPAQQGIALTITLVLTFHVAVERQDRTKAIHLHRMVNHQVSGYQRINLLRIAIQPCDGCTHRRQICYSRHASKIL